jgi:hypothetical protein
MKPVTYYRKRRHLESDPNSPPTEVHRALKPNSPRNLSFLAVRRFLQTLSRAINRAPSAHADGALSRDPGSTGHTPHQLAVSARAPECTRRIRRRVGHRLCGAQDLLENLYVRIESGIQKQKEKTKERCDNKEFQGCNPPALVNSYRRPTCCRWART